MATPPGTPSPVPQPLPPQAPAPVQQVQMAPTAARAGVLPAAVWVVIGLAAWWVARLLLGQLGVGGTLAVGLLALLPLAVCVMALLWVDRWDPEPRGVIFFCLAWGAAPAVALALWSASVFDAASLGGWASLAFAPITEELAKGLGVLLLFGVARKHVYGPVDGVVVGGLIGAGFAFTENLLYFWVAAQDGGASLAGSFVGRGVLSPFAHVLFTAITGAAVGWGSERWARWSGLLIPWICGLVPAMLAHLAWNALAEGVTPLGFLEGYLYTQVPLFLVCVAAALFFARREVRLCASALQEYERAGWYTPQEVQALSSPRGRRAGRKWAAKRGAKAAYKHVVRTADRLAVLRQRQLKHPHDQQLAAEQSLELHRSLTAREALRNAVASGPGGWTAHER